MESLKMDGSQKFADGSDFDGAGGTYLNSKSKIIGNVVLRDSARIDGKVEGDIVATGAIVIGDTAIVSARIQAPAVVVCGKVNGDISAGSIEIGAKAKVVGNLSSAFLNVEHGAVLDGRCSVSGIEEAAQSRGQPEASPLREPPSANEQVAAQAPSSFVTSRQRADLRARGYKDESIDTMTPLEVHTILGLS
jgi:cytoskeletal protein CcmA (bactofilin family)